FVAAWNAHDPKAFERLYTADAVWVPVAEERTRGRPAIVAEFAKIHTGEGWARRTTIGRKGTAEVRMLRPDVATIFF
ncbi:SgcJ/EcaC family oxidoreductase, partial [Klebsiella pneumoniae]|nr:SgcJ/EcaC family oxidoreductase [Klebsiella pneumoniae]